MPSKRLGLGLPGNIKGFGRAQKKNKKKMKKKKKMNDANDANDANCES